MGMTQKKIYLESEVLEAVERYRARQRPIPSFAAAIIQLVKKALGLPTHEELLEKALKVRRR